MSHASTRPRSSAASPWAIGTGAMAASIMAAGRSRGWASTRRRSILLLPIILSLAIGGCDEAARTPEGNGRDIVCGPQGQAPSLTCRLQVQDRNGDLTLLLRQPEGGFRRLVWPRGGQLASADGAETLTTAPLPGGGVEARIGGWAYRIERGGGGLP